MGDKIRFYNCDSFWGFVGEDPRKVDETKIIRLDNSADILGAACEFLFPMERRILEMVKDGKTKEQIARLLELRSKQHADMIVKKVIWIARFYCEHIHLINSLPLYGPNGSCLLTSFELRICNSLLVERQGFREIADNTNCKEHQIRYIVEKIKMRFKDGGLLDFVRLLELSSKIRWSKGKMICNSWRDRFRKVVFDLLLNKNVWYQWGGQSPFSEFPIADCSGFVLEVLKHLGKLPSTFPDKGARAISEMYTAIDESQIEPGDLVFYGPTWERLTHVMFYLGEVHYLVDSNGSTAEGAIQAIDWSTFSFSDRVWKADQVVGMTGGRRNMSFWQAQFIGSGLFVRNRKYRRDYLGCCRID